MREQIIAVDGRTVFATNRRGTGKNLIDLYSVLATIRPNWRFVFFHQHEVPSPFSELPNIEARRIDIRGDRFNLWQDLRLPLASAMAHADLLHSPANTGPTWSATPQILTVHDLIPYQDNPESPVTTAWMKRVAQSIRRARYVLTPSEYTRQLLLESTSARPDQVVVNPWAPDRSCVRVTSRPVLDSLKVKYGVPVERDYILAYGADDPRKNTERLIRAWALVPAELRRGCNLLVVGIGAGKLQHFEQLMAAATNDRSCLIRGFADEADMSGLLSGAQALCYPSLNEGFGLPVLDAFKCRTPVIASNRTSIPEVTGDAALLIDPADTTNIADAMSRLISSPSLRESFADAGATRVKLFSWMRVAETVADTFEKALQS